jgi:hypothetical protein
MFARHREALLAAAVSGVASALLVWLGPHGGDYAAHAYQRELFIRHGFTFWDNYWYAGRYAFVGYSLLYYPLAAWLGIAALAVLSAVVAAAAFASVVEREWGSDAVWAGRAFAVLWAGVVLTGEFPFMLGVALALVALAALQAGRPWIWAALVFAVVAASPVAFVLLAVAAVGVGAVRRYRVGAPVALVASGVAELVVQRVFAAGGTLGFAWPEALEAIAFCLGGVAMTLGSERAGPLRRFLTLYLVVVVAAWLVPSGLGHDVARLRLLALPLVLVLAALRRWRPLPVVAAALLVAAVWNVQPLASQWVASSDDGSRAAAVWTAPVAWLHAHLRPGYRVEAVDTSQHWAAYYLAGAGIPLARGWFRQDDFPFNRPLYEDSLTSAAYVAWLHRLGVAYVVGTRFPLEHTAVAEDSPATLLPVVFHHADMTIYAVPHARPIVGGGAQVLELGQASLVVRVPRAGGYRVAMRWSPFVSSSVGAVTRTSDDMVRLRTPRAGIVRLSFAP